MSEPTLELLQKIARLAGDERGDPATREVAYAKLRAFHETHPHLFKLEESPPPLDEEPEFEDVSNWREADPQNPRWFFDMNKWSRTTNGNLQRPVAHQVHGRLRVLIFPYKKSPHEFGWIRYHPEPHEAQIFCVRRSTSMANAMEDAWWALERL